MHTHTQTRLIMVTMISMLWIVIIMIMMRIMTTMIITIIIIILHLLKKKKKKLLILISATSCVNSFHVASCRNAFFFVGKHNLILKEKKKRLSF